MRAQWLSITLLIGTHNILGQGLSIGDSVPNIQFDQTINYPSPTVRLSDFPGKLLIIDFWATWCTACLHSFPTLDSLQSEMKDNLQVILINAMDTRDDVSAINKFLSKWKANTGKDFKLLTVISDTIANKLFQHNLIPHYVWISKERKVIAFSSSDALTKENIEAALQGLPLSFAMKKDQDMERPIFLSKDMPRNNLLNYSLLLKGWFDGLPSGNRFHEKNDTVCGMAITNSSILDMYKIIARRIDPSLSEKRFIVKIKDSSQFFPPTSPEDRDGWYKVHAYSLDVIVPPGEADRLDAQMLTILNTYCGYEGHFEKQKIRCWRLVRVNTTAKAKSPGNESENGLWNDERPFLQNGSTKMLTERLNNVPFIHHLVVDETGLKGNIDIKFPNGFKDFETIRQQLRAYGLSLIGGEKYEKLFIVKPK